MHARPRMSLTAEAISLTLETVPGLTTTVEFADRPGSAGNCFTCPKRCRTVTVPRVCSRSVWPAGGADAGVEDHKPDVDLRHDGVTVRLITYTDDYYGMSQRDVEMARQISAAARRLGLSADRSAVQSLLVIPGATSTAEAMPVLAHRARYQPRCDSPAEDLKWIRAVGGRGSGRDE